MRADPDTTTSPLAPRDIVPLLEDAAPATADGRTIAEPDRRLGRRLRPSSSLGCAAYNALAVPGPARHLRRRSGHARPRLRRQPVLVGAARQLLDDPNSAWWDDSRDGGRHRDLGRDRRPGDGRGRRGAARARSAAPTAGRGAASTRRRSARRRSGDERHRAARVVLQRGPACRARDRRGRQQHVLPVLVAPTPTRPIPTTSRSASTTSST